MLRTLVALLAAAGLACATAPASTPSRVVPAGVEVAGVRVGGLTAEPARTALEDALSRPVAIEFRGKTTTIDPRRAGAVVDVDAAVSSALAATPHSSIALPLRTSAKKVDAIVAKLAKQNDLAAISSEVIGADANGPEFSTPRAGLAVDTAKTRAALLTALRDGSRAPVKLATKTVPAKPFSGPVIVITRAANTLRLYSGNALVRTFRVATGQAIYPTPAGVWRIMDKQRNPWWYPPTYDSWAKGLKPVPPGPTNPLGTRWMGLSAPGVGIHGTDAPTSIGYSASHGCVRMQVPDAEWLFEHVSVGTPVVIL